MQERCGDIFGRIEQVVFPEFVPWVFPRVDWRADEL